MQVGDICRLNCQGAWDSYSPDDALGRKDQLVRVEQTSVFGRQDRVYVSLLTPDYNQSHSRRILLRPDQLDKI